DRTHLASTEALAGLEPHLEFGFDCVVAFVGGELAGIGEAEAGLAGELPVEADLVDEGVAGDGGGGGGEGGAGGAGEGEDGGRGEIAEAMAPADQAAGEQ